MPSVTLKTLPASAPCSNRVTFAGNTLAWVIRSSSSSSEGSSAPHTLNSRTLQSSQPLLPRPCLQRSCSDRARASVNVMEWAAFDPVMAAISCTLGQIKHRGVDPDQCRNSRRARISGMIEQFRTFRLDVEGARTAYALVRMHDASISLGIWLRFARRRCRTAAERAGLIGIRDGRGIVHAVFSYRIDLDLHSRKRLCITHLIVAHLPGSRIDDAVTTSTADISVQFGCQTITVEQPFRKPRPARMGCPTAEA